MVIGSIALELITLSRPPKLGGHERSLIGVAEPMSRSFARETYCTRRGIAASCNTAVSVNWMVVETF